jgi:hypothetical protein
MTPLKIKVTRIVALVMIFATIILADYRGRRSDLMLAAVWVLFLIASFRKYGKDQATTLRLVAIAFSVLGATTLLSNTLVWDGTLLNIVAYTILDGYPLTTSILLSWLMYFVVTNSENSPTIPSRQPSGAVKLVTVTKGPAALQKDQRERMNHNAHSPSQIPDQFYDFALREFGSTSRDTGLYARLYASLDGDERKVLARYLEIRAAKLYQERSYTAEKSHGSVRGAEIDVRALPSRLDLVDVLRMSLKSEEIKQGFRVYTLQNSYRALHFGSYFLIYQSVATSHSAIERAASRSDKQIDLQDVIGVIPQDLIYSQIT